jgi:tetratricopeptide (TPR) repeat protein
MRLNPNYSWAPHWYGLFLAPRRSLAEALHYLTRARDLEPLAPIANAAIGIPYHLHRQYQEAARIYSAVIDSEARFSPARFYLGQTLEQLGRYEPALEHMVSSPSR